MARTQDEQLVARILERDEKTLYELYSMYQKPLYLFIYRRLQDKTISEELAHDVFLHFLESLRDFRFQCSLKTFMFTIARNKMIDYMRKKKIKGVLLSTLPQFMVENLTQVMDDSLEKKELTQRLETTFDGLPHEYQVILRLKYIENKSVKHISESLVKTMKSTESLLFRARTAFIKIYGGLP